ncbi:MAG: phage baseplate assembly protein V [Novosphingobium sp.]
MGLAEELGLMQGRSWVEIGTVITPPAPSAVPGAALASRMVQVELRPSGRYVEARVANIGQGLGKGVFAPLLSGDEVLVLFPGGDAHRAVVLGGLGNATAPNPTENQGLQMLIQHPGGVLISNVDGAPGNGIVHGQFLNDLATYLTAFEAFLFTTSTATTAPQIAAAASTLMVAIQKVGPASSVFLSALLASAASGVAPGIGGPPYATTLHKVSP